MPQRFNRKLGPCTSNHQKHDPNTHQHVVHIRHAPCLLHMPSPINHNSLSHDIQITLNGKVNDLEIKQAILSFKPYKALGLDGFHPVFFQRYWNIVGLSVIFLIKTIFQSKKVPKNLNPTLICLIPKTKRPETVHQFQPIGLSNTLYKIITKLLVQRLKAFLPDLIHLFQASFVPRR